jgi:hypothetical protein
MQTLSLNRMTPAIYRAAANWGMGKDVVPCNIAELYRSARLSPCMAGFNPPFLSVAEAAAG